MSGIIQVFKDGTIVQEVELVTSNEYIAGREAGTDIHLDKLPGISRKHFKILFTGSNWKVECLSSMKLTEFRGIETQSFDLNEACSFLVPPYRFVFQPSTDQAETGLSRTAIISENFSDSELENVDFSAPEEAPQDPSEVEPALDAEVSDDPIDTKPNFDSPDDATAIKSFQGSPYLKIMGIGKRKTEYYRLEGQLWVAGSDKNAGVYLPDKKAAAAHFEITKTDKEFYIIDLGSPTGTLLNGQHISTSKKSLLVSGDFINVGGLTLQFELRDQFFKERVKSIPLHMYENPLVFFGQDAGSLDTSPPGMSKGKAEEILNAPIEIKTQGRQKTLVIYGIVIAVLIGGLLSLEKKQVAKTQVPVQNLDPFQKLSSQNQKIVKDTYNLAKKLYLNSQFELALKQFENLHRILDIGYLDSKQIEEYCLNSRELKMQQVALENQRNEQRRIQTRIKTVLKQCRLRFGDSVDLNNARICLSDAIQLDPNNPGINDLLSKISARIEVRKTSKKIAEQRKEQARRGRNLYLKAKALHDGKDFIGAMEAYESHINSGLPDPGRLVNQSRRKLSSIQKYIDRKKTALVSSAKTELQSANLKKAVQLARQAAEVDPYDYTISTFLHTIEKELNTKMKNIYRDSVIEERFGNIEASREKWNKIIDADVEDGEYTKKAKRKLIQYGL